MSSPREKCQACSQLKRIGTRRSVKALSALLTNPQLSQSARYVLESMPAPEAGKALRQALTRTSGPIQAGIVNSLAARGDTAAVPDLCKLVSSPDEMVAVASAEALGRIGTSRATKFLQKEVLTSTGPVHGAEVDAILTSANQLLDSGHQKDALKLFQGLYAVEKADVVRLAAFRGIILSSVKRWNLENGGSHCERRRPKPIRGAASRLANKDPGSHPGPGNRASKNDVTSSTGTDPMPFES